MERSKSLLNDMSRLGMIVPISISSAEAFLPLRKSLDTRFNYYWFAHYSNRPGQLFEGAQNRLTIFVAERAKTDKKIFATKYHRWDAKNGERQFLFSKLQYEECCDLSRKCVCKAGNVVITSVLSKLINNVQLGLQENKNGRHEVFWVRVPGYFCSFLNWHLKAISIVGGNEKPRGEILSLAFGTQTDSDVALAVLNSNLFYLYFSAYTDTRHINPSDVRCFPFSLQGVSPSLSNDLITLASKLKKDFKKKLKYVVKSGLKIESIDAQKSKHIIDEIDELLAKHYGFTEEELDFIINYDIKYRMGDELNAEE